MALPWKLRNASVDITRVSGSIDEIDKRAPDTVEHSAGFILGAPERASNPCSHG
jgi:hypothetical protein